MASKSNSILQWRKISDGGRDFIEGGDTAGEGGGNGGGGKKSGGVGFGFAEEVVVVSVDSVAGALFTRLPGFGDNLM
jgi:hypothetical protein